MPTERRLYSNKNEESAPITAKEQKMKKAA